jgi:hypothetical protein
MSNNEKKEILWEFQKLYVKLLNNIGCTHKEIEQGCNLISKFDEISGCFIDSENIKNKMQNMLFTAMYMNNYIGSYNSFINFTIYEKTTTKTFNSEIYNRPVSFIEKSITYNLDIEHEISHANINDIKYIVANEIYKNKDCDMRPYMIILSNKSKSLYFNKTPDELFRDIEKYSETIDVLAITVLYTNNNNTHIRHAPVYAGSGVPINCGDGFWLADLLISKKRCVLNAYICWKLYKKFYPLTHIYSDQKEELEKNTQMK